MSPPGAATLDARIHRPTGRVGDGDLAAQLLATKLLVPALAPEVVPRPRLVEQLNEATRRRVTLLAAPAGFGKSRNACRLRSAVATVRPPSDEIKALRALVRTRADLVRDRVALSNQLRALLESFWPGAGLIFAEIHSPISLAFLERYLTPERGRRHGYSAGPDGEGAFELSPDEVRELQASIDQASRGEVVDGWELLSQTSSLTCR